MNKYEMMFIVKATNEWTVAAGTADEIKKIAEANKLKFLNLKNLELKSCLSNQKRNKRILLRNGFHCWQRCYCWNRS